MNKKAFLQDFKNNEPKTKPKYMHSKIIDNEGNVGTTIHPIYNRVKKEWGYTVLMDSDGDVEFKYESELMKMEKK